MSGALLAAEEAVRAALLAVLRADVAVMAALHQIYERKMPRMSAPYALLGGAEGRDWGTKDRAGREVTALVTVVGGKSANRAVAEQVADIAAALRGETGGWEIVAARVMRVRWLPQDDGGWQCQIQWRCRCLKAE